ncbi:hypothetical protein [Xanthomonas phage X1]|nr:hypothetical protein [Xanthomonas phage X1]
MAKSVASLMGGGPSPQVRQHLEKFMSKNRYDPINDADMLIEQYICLVDELYSDGKDTSYEEPKEVKFITGKVKQLPDPDVNWGFSTIGDSLYD